MTVQGRTSCRPHSEGMSATVADQIATVSRCTWWQACMTVCHELLGTQDMSIHRLQPKLQFRCAQRAENHTPPGSAAAEQLAARGPAAAAAGGGQPLPQPGAQHLRAEALQVVPAPKRQFWFRIRRTCTAAVTSAALELPGDLLCNAGKWAAEHTCPTASWAHLCLPAWL